MTEQDPAGGQAPFTAPAYPQYQQPTWAPAQSGGIPAQPALYPAAGYGGPVPPPPSNVGWAVAAVVLFWPLAFSAFTHALSVYPKWAMGDFQGAQYSSERTKTLGKISIGCAVGLFVLMMLLYFMLIAVFVASVDSTY